MTIFVGVEEEKDSEKKRNHLTPHQARSEVTAREGTGGENIRDTPNINNLKSHQCIVQFHKFSTLLATHTGQMEFRRDEECKLDMS